MPIFQDHNGLAVKFFVQKDLPQEIQAELCETIASLGGRVESKVPRQGYILVQPGTAEEERLRLCWTSDDRPDRHFVPYTYVEACKMAGMLLKQIFVEHAAPIGMHIHQSIANPNARNVLSQRIMHSGGDPYASLQSARVILADPNTEIFQHLVKVYQGVPDKYIESYLWVKKCIEKGSVVYTPLVYKNPGGRRPGEERTQFTEEDEEHLCTWIAQKIPYKETGGRTGNRLYQQLCDLAADPEYAWVTRHTWQSWRERYKKNAARLDSIIASIVEQKKPGLGEKGQYGYVRQAEDKPKRSRKRRAKSVSTTEELNDVSKYGMDMTEVPTIAMPAIANMVPIGVPGQDHLQPEGGAFQSIITSSVTPTLYTDATHTGPAEEEMDEIEDEEDWAVKVGNAPPPAWSRKREGDEESLNHPQKRMRVSALDPHEGIGVGHRHPPGLTNEALVQIASLHVGIDDIAKETRFTVEEVQEYYNKTGGDLERTRTRFHAMRRELRLKFGDE